MTERLRIAVALLLAAGLMVLAGCGAGTPPSSPPPGPPAETGVSIDLYGEITAAAYTECHRHRLLNASGGEEPGDEVQILLDPTAEKSLAEGRRVACGCTHRGRRTSTRQANSFRSPR